MNKFNRGLVTTILLIGVIILTGCRSNSDGNKYGEEDKGTTVVDVEITDENNKSNIDLEVTKELDSKNNEDTSLKDEEYIPDFIHQGEPIDYTQYNFYQADLYVKAPAYHQVTHGLECFHYGNKINIGYYPGQTSDLDGIETVDDILETLQRRLIKGSDRYMYGEFDYFEFESEEKTNINDIEMMRYEGNMIVTGYEENKRYVVIYTFIYNGVPNAIFGYAGDTDQSPDDIKEMIHNIDESAKTIVPKNYLVK